MEEVDVVGINEVSSFFRHDLLHVSDMVDSMLSKHNWMILELIDRHFIVEKGVTQAWIVEKGVTQAWIVACNHNLRKLKYAHWKIQA